MTLKEKLRQFSDIKKEINELCNKINNYQTKNKVVDLVKGTPDIFPYVEKSYKIEGVDPKTKEIISTHLELLHNRYDKLLLIKIEVENYIENLPTSRLRRIFEYRYINNYKWNKIAILIGGNATADSVRMEHDRFLEKN